MASSRLAAVLAATAVLGGCGGGGDGDGSGEPSTKAGFIAAGDRICLEREQRSRKLATAVRSDADIARLTGALAEIYATTIAKLRALPLPPGDARAGAGRYLRSVEAMSRPVARMKAAAGELAAAAGAQSSAKVKRAARDLQGNVNTVQAIGDLADQHARAYGFRTCGQQQPAAPVS